MSNFAFPTYGGNYTFRHGSYLIPQGAQAPIYFDCVVSEQVIRSAEVTEFPVEQGANITDHYRVKTNEVSFEVFVSEEPLEPDVHPEGGGFSGAQTLVLPAYPQPPIAGFPGTGDLNVAASAIGNPVGFASSALRKAFDPRENPVIMQGVLQWANTFSSLQALLTTLDAIRSSATLVDIYTIAKVYTGFALVGVETNRDKETGTGTRVRLAFKELVQVSTQQVAAPAIPQIPKDRAPVNKGAQQPKDPGQMQSLASAGLAGLQKLIGGGF